MDLAARMKRLESQIEAMQLQDPVPSERSGAQPFVESETLADLAAQWRNAYVTAQAQEQRLTAVQHAAAKLHYLDEPTGEEGEFLFQAAQKADAAWWRRAEAIDVSLGLYSQEEAANCAWGVVEQLAERLLRLRPKNVQEAAIKFGVLMTILKDDNYEIDQPEHLNGFLEDLTRLAESGAR